MAKTTTLDAAALLKRIEERGYHDVPAIDPATTRWVHAHAEAYAISIVRRGLVKGRRETGNGAAARRNLMPRLEQRLEHLKERLNQLEDIRGGGEVAVEIAEQPREWAEEMEADVINALERSVRIISDDQELFNTVSINGATPQEGDIQRHVVIDAWIADGRVTLVARAIASGIYGIVGMTIQTDGRLVEDELAKTLAGDRQRFATRMHAIIHDTTRTIIRTTGRRRVKAITPAAQRGDEADIAETESKSPAIPIEMSIAPPVIDLSTWEGVSAELPTPLLTSVEVEALTERAGGNAVLRTLVDQLRPMVERDNQPPASAEDTPFSKLAIAACIRDGDVDAKRREILANARDMITRTRKTGDEAMVRDLELMANEIDTPAALPEIAREAAQERFGRLEPAYNAAARFLATLAQRVASGHDVEIGAHTAETSEDDACPELTASFAGMLAIRDRAMFDAAADRQVKAEVKRRDGALIMLFDATPAMIEALIVQIDERGLTLGAYERVEAIARDGESDLAWHVRRIVCEIAARKAGNSPVAKQDAASDGAATTKIDRMLAALGEVPLAFPPVVRRNARPTATGIMRVICQVRLGMPVDDVDLVERIAESWFAQQSRIVRSRITFDGYDPLEGWRLEHRGDTSDVHWSTRARINRGEQPSIDISVATSQKRSASPRLPRLVRMLCKATTMTGPDGPMFAEAVAIDSNAAMADFRRLATDQARELPITLFTRDDSGNYACDPDGYAAKAAGTMHVFTMGRMRTFDLSDSWGRDMSAYLGGVRHYRQKLNPDVDSRHQHPLIMPGPDAARHLDELLNRATAATLHRYDLTPIDQPAKSPADIQTDGPPTRTDVDTSNRPAGDDKGQTPIEERKAEPARKPIQSFLSEQSSGFGGAGTSAGKLAPEKPTSTTMAEAPSTETPATTDYAPSPSATNISTDEGKAAEGSRTKVEQPSEAEWSGDDDLDFSQVGFEDQDTPKATTPRTKRSQADRQIDKGAVGFSAEMLTAAIATAMAPFAAEMAEVGRRLGNVEEMLTAQTGVADTQDSADRAATAEEELARERRENDELIQMAESERNEVIAENETLRERVRHLEEQVAKNQTKPQSPEGERLASDVTAPPTAEPALSSKDEGQAKGDPIADNDGDDDQSLDDDQPTQLDEIPAWARRTLAGRVVILARCERTLQKAQHDNIGRLMDAIKLLGTTYVDMKQGRDGAREEWLKGLEQLRLGDTPHQKWGGPAADGDYTIVYRGEKHALDKHIRGLESAKNDRQLIRIYYTYHEATGQVLIGHMPGHLASKSR